MGLFDKLKNVFIEEDDEEIQEITPKKEEKKVDITNDEENVMPIKEVSDDTFSDRQLLDTNDKFKFPIIFEDDDFKEERKKTKSINVLDTGNTKREPEIKKDIKSTKKTFKPSPVISPVYGVLDKNYSKEDIKSKDGLLSDYDSKVDIDYVINKAYGDNKEEKKEEKPIELFEQKEEVVTIDNSSMQEVDEKIKSIDELLKDTTDDDFYSLVDSMYKEEGDE